MEQKLILMQKQSKEQELVIRFKAINNKYLGALESNIILNKLIKIRNNHNDDVTQRTLARILGTNQRKIRSLLAWNYATPYMTKYVEEHPKLTIKSMYILCECKLYNKSEEEANKKFDILITKPSVEINKIGSSLRLDEHYKSIYKNPFQIVRGIARHCDGIRRTLLSSYNNIPKGQIPQLNKILKNHIKVLKIYLNNEPTN